jgi:DNA-binding response OmpR family regulator
MPQIQDASLEERHATRKAILIVEDDPYIASFLVMAIAQETPYHPLLAETGERALEMVRHVKPALFILDYILGTMNGLDLYDYLHTQQGFEAIPAIFLSASSERLQDETDQRHLIGLAKPIELDELLLSVRQALGVHQEER